MARVFVGRVDANLEQCLEEALQFIDWEKIVPKGARVFFKPNLTYPSPKPGVTTTPGFIEAVLHVFSQRTSNLIVGESDGGYRGWPAEIAFQTHGLPEICARNGVQLVNLSKQPRTALEFNLSRGRVLLELPTLLLEGIDVLVTLPVPKIHQITLMSGAIKNQWGCIPDNMRIVNHPYFDEMILEINRQVKTHLALADGSFFLNRTGPLVGEPIPMNLLIASDSIGALDLTICRIMGLDANHVRHLAVAKRHGWIPATSLIEHNTSPDNFRTATFYLQQTPRSRVVRWAFDHPLAIRIFWNSWFADLFHKLLYAMTGNSVREEISLLHNQEHHGQER